MKVSQRSFFEFFLNAFVTERGCLDAFTEKLIEECSPVGKKSAALLQKTKSRGNKDLDSLNLSEREREEIFDILELENFD